MKPKVAVGRGLFGRGVNAAAPFFLERTVVPTAWGLAALEVKLRTADMGGAATHALSTPHRSSCQAQGAWRVAMVTGERGSQKPTREGNTRTASEEDLADQCGCALRNGCTCPTWGGGGGQNDGEGADEGRHTDGEVMHDCLMTTGSAVKAAPLSSNSTVSSGDLAGQEPCAGTIRGRGFPPGSGVTTGSPSDEGLSGRTGIRGRDIGALGSEPGGSVRPTRGLQEGRQSAQSAKDEAGSLVMRGAARHRNPGMDWYFANIADAVAKRKAALGAQEGPSAADRMTALRRRIASRVSGAGVEEDVMPTAAQRTTSARSQADPQGVLGLVGEATSWGRRSMLGPGAVTSGPSCSTASTEAATAVAHHAVEDKAEGQGVVGEMRRRPQSGARASWSARQALIDRLGTSTSPSERTD